MELRKYLDKSRNMMMVTVPAVRTDGRSLKGYSIPLVFYMYWN
jgi:hypothetical protein